MKTPQNTSKRAWAVREAGFGPFRPDETGRNPSGWGGRKTRAPPRVFAWRREGDVGAREEDDAGRRSKTTPPPKLPPRSKTTPSTLPPLRKKGPAGKRVLPPPTWTSCRRPLLSVEAGVIRNKLLGLIFL
nr:uncharacterized protein LOC127332460 isoform X2 [Lolium perenne]